MLLHDSYFHSLNKSINATHHETIIMAYSPLFHSTFTLIISIFGFLFNLLCSIKIWFIIHRHQQQKLSKTQQKQQPQQQQQQSQHILAHNKYRFLYILTSNDLLLCLSSIVSCLDEKYFFQSFLGRHHLCSAHILIWKFTLHFVPLLTIAILCRYHYMLNKTFQTKSTNLSTFTQLLCTDLSILIAFVLALAWSVDGLWLWGVADIKNYHRPEAPFSSEDDYHNKTIDISAASSMNRSLLESNTYVDENDENLYLPEQKTICSLQTNHNFEFSLRLVHLIQADFLLLLTLHLIGLFLEIFLHIRLCCCVVIKKVTTAFSHERQLCIYILYMFILLTITSLPFYIYRTLDTVFEFQFISVNTELINSRIFAQILLMGTCFKPLLVLILFVPSSILFHLKYYSTGKTRIKEQEEQLLPLPNHQNQQEEEPQQQRPRYSLFTCSSYHPKLQLKSRTQSNPILSTNTTLKSEHLHNSMKLTKSVVIDESIEPSNDVYV